MAVGIENLRDNYSVAFFDIDNTLTIGVSYTRDITTLPFPGVQEALQKFVDAGNAAFICTGRATGEIAAQMEHLPMAGFVSLAGAYAEVCGKPVVDGVIEPELANELLEAMDALPITFNVVSTSGLFTVQRAKPRGETQNIYPSLEAALKDFPNPEVLKVNTALPYWEMIKEAYPNVSAFEHTSSNPNAQEITRKGVTKASGAQAVLDALPEGRGTVFAFGDSDNDLPVLKMADISVAMGNSLDSVKEACTFVAPGVHENGVEKALYHFEDIWQG